MIVVMKTKANPADIQIVKNKILDMELEVYESIGLNYHLIGIVGDTSKVDVEVFTRIQSVEKVIQVQGPYKKASRLFHPENSIISVGNNTIGGNKLAIIAGPCSVESEQQIIEIAEKVKKAGAGFLRGGAFKPRTSPYSFQGLKERGLELLKYAREKSGLPIVVELMSTDKLDLYERDVDIIQIGARNMQNFDLLRAVGRTRKPILLKRGFSATIEEFLMAAEYIMAGGNENIILCERGIRTFENYTRNTLDLSAIPAIKKLSHLPIIVDPSHASGIWWMVEPLAKAAIAVGADGIMIEVHNDPTNALCDGSQSIKPEKFQHLMGCIRDIAKIQNREI
ncbi:MAG TPA: 3-deoxy-7-phosphoheptulonate synthase [Thermoanaerobacterales bacterium]|jgi:3-deoxy-7-phosphoheptulonate synthase|nr:3-deoxy-7-phosphoheptulonate synthase [Thermoanaerobacterales bacterium]